MSSSKPKGIPPPSKIPASGHDSGTHSRSSSVSNLTSASDLQSEAGDVGAENFHGFKVEDKIYVNGNKPGIIKFLGKTEFAIGAWAGILLDEPVGKNDGSVAGVKYFTCKPLYGIFARPQKLTRTPGPLPDAVGSRASSPRGSTTGSIRCTTPSVGSLVMTPGSSRPCCSRLKIGEKVVVSSATGVKSGTVRFIGETEFAKGGWAGIELDEPVGKNDGSVAGKRYFSCEMKYGLFSPLHKVSRTGGTTTPRTPSVRGTPLRRSNSRDSMSSSVSNCSRTSKVKLGITSLTPKTSRTGKGLVTTSTALQEAIKEKEHHIEQLLKEQDLERNEVARITSLWEQAETKYSELQRFTQASQAERKSLEEQLAIDRRKLEDAQFLLEEEKIVKGDLEMHLENQKKILNRLQDFISENSDIKALNVKEILEGKDTLSPVSICQTADPLVEVYKKRCSDLDTEIQKLAQEKTESLKGLDVLNIQLKETQVRNDDLLESLNSSIQEKADTISRLQSELNTVQQTLSTVRIENDDLNEKIEIQAAQARGETDNVVKELGEKIKSISAEVDSKRALLQEYETTMKAKDDKIDLLYKDLNDHTTQYSELKQQLTLVQTNLEEKNAAIDKKVASETLLNQEIDRLKAEAAIIQVQEEKILGLVKDIEGLSKSIQEKDVQLSQQTNTVSHLNGEIDSMRQTNETLQAQIKEIHLKSSDYMEESDGKIKSLHADLKKAESEKTELAQKYDEETKKLLSKIDHLSREIEEKESSLNENITQLSVLNQSVDEKDAQFANNEKELDSLKKTLNSLNHEKTALSESLRNKDQLLSQLQAEFEIIKKEVDVGNQKLSEVNLKADALQTDLKEKSNENAQLSSKLQVAEQKVEMLNKDSSQHVMSLQKELSKLKEDNVCQKSAHEKEISAAQSETANLAALLVEKSTALEENQNKINKLNEELLNKENTISNMSSEFSKVTSNISSLSNEKDEMIVVHEKALQTTKDDLTSQLNTKELRITQLESETEKMAQVIAEKNRTLDENNSAISALRDSAQSKDGEITDLKAKLEALDKNISVLVVNKESSEKELQSTLEEVKLLKDGKEKAIALLETRLTEFNEKLSAKETEISENNAAIEALKSSLKEKDSQLDELTKTVQASEEQLKNLNDTNAHNTNLLESKDGLLVDFTSKTEKKISDLQENFRRETQSFKEIISKHEENIKEKEEIISKLNSEAEKRVKELEEVGKDLSLTKETNLKATQEKDAVHKNLTEQSAALEMKYSHLMEIKQKLEAEQLKSQAAATTLEGVRDSLLQEKDRLEASAKEKDAQLAQLQADMARMQQESSEHKRALEHKLEASEKEKQAAIELKNSLDLQHSVAKDLQQSLDESEEKNKKLDVQIQQMSLLVSAKDEQLQTLELLETETEDKSIELKRLAEKCSSLQKLLESNESNLIVKEKECVSLLEKISSLHSIKESDEQLKKKMKLLEQEHMMLKMQNEKLEKIQAGKRIVASSELNANQANSEEMESLTMQIDFLNSIIVDMKQKNEKLEQENEVLKMGPPVTDTNFNDVPKKLAPRLFCDICDIFDLHDTDDCPKQESFLEDEDEKEVPHMVLQGSRKLEERPYCSICEEFGHWTQDCTEQDEY